MFWREYLGALVVFKIAKTVTNKVFKQNKEDFTFQEEFIFDIRQL